MIKLMRITGESLQLIFNPQGALSSAKLADRNVTHDLRYLRMDDYLDSLRLIGFKPQWDAELQESIRALDRALRLQDLMVFNVEVVRAPQYHVYLCASTDPHFLHKRTQAVMQYDINERRLNSIVRLFELDYSSCKQLMEVAYVSDTQAV